MFFAQFSHLREREREIVPNVNLVTSSAAECKIYLYLRYLEAFTTQSRFWAMLFG